MLDKYKCTFLVFISKYCSSSKTFKFEDTKGVIEETVIQRTNNTMTKKKMDKRTNNTMTKRKWTKGKQYNDKEKMDKRTNNTMTKRKWTKGQTIQ